ncbi:hypothetical protein FFI94_022075 [Rhodococcus sp. KBS0724]|uniref:hypothetical protein n=1 Tax=Rhodococcus sp. KBS0724 TaxID=1179674 RepID=UPI00110F3EED|nr:hypothetical protein [Rhodococcus sp. KBS0724]TSD48554.1 hypothetical protein FFI94_022075 [Rhodococcus sp. KBS0724]
MAQHPAPLIDPEYLATLNEPMKNVLTHIFSSPNPVAFHLDGTIPVDTITPAQPPQGVDYRHGGYYLIEYVGGGTAEAYGDQILMMAGAA